MCCVLLILTLLFKRVHLQHLLETRRAMLLRSQAMAYARGRAAGFDVENMDELIAFSETFGASRLRYQEQCNYAAHTDENLLKGAQTKSSMNVY